MKKLFGLALVGIMCAAFAGCATANADRQGVPLVSVDESISLKDGYYTNDNDESYIRIEGNKIELSGLDIEAYAEKSWEDAIAELDSAERERQLTHRDEYINNTMNDAKATFALQEYTPVTFSLPDQKRTVLALNYVKDSQTYEGYSLKSDDSIGMIGNVYHYCGTELPQ